MPDGRDTVNVSVRAGDVLDSPSTTLPALPIENFGSSSVIVPVALEDVPRAVPVEALLSVTVNVSLAPSSVVSPVTETVNVWLVAPAANDSEVLDIAV